MTEIGTQQVLNSYLVLGALLLVFVSFVPHGLVPLLGDLLQNLREVVVDARKGRFTAGR